MVQNIIIKLITLPGNVEKGFYIDNKKQIRGVCWQFLTFCLVIYIAKLKII